MTTSTPTAGPAGTETRRGQVPAGNPSPEPELASLSDAEKRRLAREIAGQDPSLSGAQIAERFGKDERWGRRQRAAALGSPGSDRSPSPKAGRTVRARSADTDRTATTAGRRQAAGQSRRAVTGHSDEVTGHTPDTSASGATALVPLYQPPGATSAGSPNGHTQAQARSRREGPGRPSGQPQQLSGHPEPETPGQPPRTDRTPPDSDRPAQVSGQAETGRTDPTGETDDPIGLSALILLAMAAAMAWSWDHLAHVAVMAGARVGPFGWHMKWLLPISVDVQLVASAWKTRRLAAAGRRAGNVTYAAMVGSAFMSLAGNVIGTLDQAGIIPPIEQWDTPAAVAVVVAVGLWMPTAAILGLEVLRDRGRPIDPAPALSPPNNRRS